MSSQSSRRTVRSQHRAGTAASALYHALSSHHATSYTKTLQVRLRSLTLAERVDTCNSVGPPPETTPSPDEAEGNASTPSAGNASRAGRKRTHYRGSSFGVESAVVAEERSPGQNSSAHLQSVKEEEEHEAEESDRARIARLEKEAAASRQRELDLIEEVSRLRRQLKEATQLAEKQAAAAAASTATPHSSVTSRTTQCTAAPVAKSDKREAEEENVAGGDSRSGEGIEHLNRKQELIAEIFESEQENLRAENRKLRRLLLQGASQEEVKAALSSGPCAMTLVDISLLIEERLGKRQEDARSETDAVAYAPPPPLRLRKAHTEADEQLEDP